MLKLYLNPNYKQVLSELSQPVSTDSTPDHCAHCCAQVFFLVRYKINLEEKNNHQVCVGKGILHVFCDVLNSVIDFMMMKRGHVREGNAIKWQNITNAILYIGLMNGVINLYTLKKFPVEAG